MNTPANLLPPAAQAFADVVIDHLTYANYAHNRAIAPHISPERWAKVYPNAAALEARYQEERNAGARQADDVFCQGCGARGTSLCGGCQ